MKNRNKNKEVNPKHQKQVHEKKRQNICWKQRNIGNKYDLRKKTALKYYANRSIAAYNVEIDKKVGLGLLNEERANNMKEELSRKVDTLIQMWSEAGEKRNGCKRGPEMAAGNEKRIYQMLLSASCYR